MTFDRARVRQIAEERALQIGPKSDLGDVADTIYDAILAAARELLGEEPSASMLKASDTIIQGYGAKLVWARMSAARLAQLGEE